MPKKQTTVIMGILLLLMSFLIFAQQQDTLNPAISTPAVTQDTSSTNVTAANAVTSQQNSQITSPEKVTKEISVWWIIGSIGFAMPLLRFKHSII